MALCSRLILLLYIFTIFSPSLCFRGRLPLSGSREPGRLLAKKSWAPPPSSSSPSPAPILVPTEVEPAPTGVAFTIDLPKRAGINWGSDLSFRWIKVLSMDPNGEAALSNVIQKVEMKLSSWESTISLNRSVSVN